MVRVEPMTEEWLVALADGDPVFTERFGIQVEPDWAGFPGVIEWALGELRKGEPAEWGMHLFFDDDGTLVGNGGWKGVPVDGAAELGYSVAPSRQRRGIATAAVNELLARAQRAGLRIAVAHTLATPSASTTVLRRCGFGWCREHLDPEDGLVWRWERALAAPR
jgi:RimJ/RimL family protein N-acetyltransferase